jgi:hypothetical protein
MSGCRSELRSSFALLLVAGCALPLAAEQWNTPQEDRNREIALNWMREVHQKDPHDPSKIYDQAWFDMVRVENGKVMEHWDGARLTKDRGREPALPTVSEKK